MKTAINLFTNLLKDESGQDLIEYALVAGLIGLGAIATMSSLGSGISTAFTHVTTRLAAAAPAS